jgi:hypothetical protein
MFFTECDYLRDEGVVDSAVIEAVDAFLGHTDRKVGDVLEIDLIARHTGCSAVEVEIVLEGLTKRAVLQRQSMVRCPDDSCRTLTPAARVEASRADGDEEPCSGPCAQDLAGLDQITLVYAYQLVALPVL